MPHRLKAKGSSIAGATTTHLSVRCWEDRGKGPPILHSLTHSLCPSPHPLVKHPSSRQEPAQVSVTAAPAAVRSSIADSSCSGSSQLPFPAYRLILHGRTQMGGGKEGQGGKRSEWENGLPEPHKPSLHCQEVASSTFHQRQPTVWPAHSGLQVGILACCEQVASSLTLQGLGHGLSLAGSSWCRSWQQTCKRGCPAPPRSYSVDTPLVQLCMAQSIASGPMSLRGASCMHASCASTHLQEHNTLPHRGRDNVVRVEEGGGSPVLSSSPKVPRQIHTGFPQLYHLKNKLKSSAWCPAEPGTHHDGTACTALKLTLAIRLIGHCDGILKPNLLGYTTVLQSLFRVKGNLYCPHSDVALWDCLIAKSHWLHGHVTVSHWLTRMTSGWSPFFKTKTIKNL